MTIPDADARASRRRSRPRRLDALDGIRTIAVMLVVAFHVSVPGFGGGYLGVDVFFVLSGFLITSLLLKEIGTRGRIDLGRFWTRRVLRLLPASLLVISAVVAWGFLVAEPYRRQGLQADALWSLLYVGNWRFISSSSYFDDDGTTSPLLHVWSLAVEEQFYVLWPLLLVGLIALVLRPRGLVGPVPVVDSAERAERHAERKRAIAAATGALATVIFVVSAILLFVLSDPAAPDRAYMGTDTKAFEPLLGAVTAALMLRPRLRSWVAQHAQALMVLGLLGIVAGVATLGGPHPAYFAGGAVAFSVAGAVLIAATSVADRRRGLCLFLGSTPMAWLGRISYGIYLWHWPLAVWIVAGHGFSPRRAALAVALTILFADLSYRFVETPIRTGRLSVRRPARVLPLAAGAMAVVLVAATLLARSPLDRVLPALAAARQDPRPIVVVGDSVMRRLVPVLAPTAAERGVTVISAARGGCPALGVPAVDATGKLLADGACAQKIPEAQAEALEQARPTAVVWWSRYELSDRLDASGHVLRAGTPEFWAAQRADLLRAVDRLTATGARLVVVETDRSGVGLRSRCPETGCDPFLKRLKDEDELRVRWNAIVRDVAADDPRVRVITMDDVYCRDDANPCDDRLPTRGATDTAFRPARDELARPDGSHFADAAMVGVSLALLQRVEEALT